MNSEDLIRKLTSRKFWVAVAGLVSGILLAFKINAATVETISGVIMAAASVIAYIVGEGMADAAGQSGETNIIMQAPDDKITEEN